jgi:hypothetical protein
VGPENISIQVLLYNNNNDDDNNNNNNNIFFTMQMSEMITTPTYLGTTQWHTNTHAAQMNPNKET